MIPGLESPNQYCPTHLRKTFPSHIRAEKDWKAMDRRREEAEGGQGTESGQGTGEGGQDPKDDDLQPNYTW
jgi:hypothetical protein